ncbi:CoA transferase [Nocardia gamkensis]|uniref:CoA transferase n=1 Tax=Nocardia gamkensis TaxID=352869 RepID=A0A7X6L140_9NOCA|nr:CoA transferase [Nocardia gamkensis]NKY25846.1 CoA transferase [Nocardia gamkensis]
MTLSASDPPAVDWAESGVVAVTGHPDGPLLVPPGRAAGRARELTSWIATVAPAITVDGARLLAERAALNNLHRRGTVSAGGRCRLLPTADGWAAISCARPDDPLLLGALIGATINAEDPWPPVADWVRNHPGAELAERAELLGVAAGPVRHEARPNAFAPMAPRPVEGLLVVDFSSLWAGPLCAHLLGLAGARVIKIETPDRPDGARRGNPAFYALLHHGHESVVLDPTDPAGRRALRALVDAADIVIEASRPRALAGFGLDAGTATARGAVWVSITAAGRESNRVGFGDDIAAAAGLVAYDAAGEPVFVGDAIADPLTGLTAAALAMSAPADGSGVLWDISMTDVVATTLTSDPVPRTRRRGGRWFIDADNGPVPVAEPTARTPPGPAADTGADTARVLESLRIPAP